MKTFANLLTSFAAFVLLLGATAADVSAQNAIPPGTQQLVWYALESGGVSTGTDCLVTAPCTFTNALLQANGAGNDPDTHTVAVRVRSSGGRALITEDVSITDRWVNFAVFNDTYGEEDEGYLVPGELEFRGVVTIAAAGASIGFIKYVPNSMLSILGDVNVTGTALADGVNTDLIATNDGTDPDDPADDPGPFPSFLNASKFRDNVVIKGNVEMMLATTCPIFENLIVATGAKLTLEGTGADCATGVGPLKPTSVTTEGGVFWAFGGEAKATDTEGAGDAIYVWNRLDVDGTVELDASLHLIAPRPFNRPDSMHAGIGYEMKNGELKPSGSRDANRWPHAEINGTINATSASAMFYVQVQQELLYHVQIDTMHYRTPDRATATDTTTTARLRVVPRPVYLGWQNERNHAYVIKGRGRINMDVMKTTQGGVRLDGVDFGTGARSNNMAGWMEVKNADVSGDFNTEGFAQTHLERSTVTRGMVLDTPMPVADGRMGIGSANAAGLLTTLSVPSRDPVAPPLHAPMLECFGKDDRLNPETSSGRSGNSGSARHLWPLVLDADKDATDVYEVYGGFATAAAPDSLLNATPSRGLTGGVYLKSVTVRETVELIDGMKRTAKYMAPKLVDTGTGANKRQKFVWEWDKEDGEEMKEVDCHGGFYVSGFGTTTFGGDLVMDDVSHLRLDANLTFAGERMDFTTTSELVVTSSKSDPGLSTGNLCSSAKPGPSGTYLTFAGTMPGQGIFGKHTLDLGPIGLRIDKSTGDRVEFNDTKVYTKMVELKGGYLETNGLLGVSGGAMLISQEHNKVADLRRGSGTIAYAKRGISTMSPTKIAYVGNLASMDTGDELYDGMRVAELEMYLASPSTRLTLLNSIRVTSQFSLSQGNIGVDAGKSVTLPTKVNVGSAYVREGHATRLDLRDDSKDIYFVTQHDRTTSEIIPSYTTLAAAKTAIKGLHNVYVQSCPSTRSFRTGLTTHYPMTITLQKGYTAVSKLIVDRRNTLDLAGNVLVQKVRFGKDFLDRPVRVGDGEMRVEGDAWVCDSMSDTSPCGKTSEAYEDLVDIADAIEAVHYDDTPENRVALTAAHAAYEASRTTPRKTSASKGMIYFYGEHNVPCTGGRAVPGLGRIAVSLKTHAGDPERLDWYFPATHVEPYTSVSFTGGGTNSTTPVTVKPDNADRLMLPNLMVAQGQVAANCSNKETTYRTSVAFDDFDYVMVDTAVTFPKRSTVSLGDDAGGHPQSKFMPGGDLMVYGQVAVGGNALVTPDSYMQGDMPGEYQSDVWLQGGTHYAMGDFYVGEGFHPDTTHIYALKSANTSGDHGMTCDSNMGEVSGRDVKRGLMAYGDYTFMGAGDAFDSKLTDVLGHRGTVTFMTNDTSMVKQGSQKATAFCHVRVTSDASGNRGMLMLASDVMQHKYGDLNLRRGLVDAGDYEWMLYNTGIEEDLTGGVAVPDDKAGVVKRGSRISYFTGTVTRVVEKGNAGGGVLTGGYLFPVGSMNQYAGPDFYRPLMMQFSNDLGELRMASVTYMPHMNSDSLALPEEGLTVDGGDDDLLLDTMSDMVWKVELDGIPAYDPNIRVSADGLPNVFDIEGLRIVQWDCDGQNPRLAGTYDTSEGETGGDDKSFFINDFLNGIPNLTQEGVGLGQEGEGPELCAYFGIAANFLDNPIGADPITGGTARVQFIHNVVGAMVDVYLDDNRIINDFDFQNARAFGVVAAGDHKLDIVPAAADDNSTPLFTEQVRFSQDKHYHVIAHGNAGAGVVAIKIAADVRTTSQIENKVDFYFVHGASGLGMIDIRQLDPLDNTRAIDLLENNFSFNDMGQYRSMDPGAYNFEVTTPNNDTQIDVYRLVIHQYANMAFVLNMSGPGTSSADGVTMMGVAEDGDPFFPQVITGTVNEELPTEFALLGNYPNPFNPSTRIEFDLPESAEVSITVFDMLGRNVMTLPTTDVEAGAGRSIELNAANLASGNYFYRVVATGASSRHVETGRMVLIK